MFLGEGQLFSIDDHVKRYYIKINSRSIPIKINGNREEFGFAVDLESGEFLFIKLDKKVILENGYVMLED